ncbi:MAG: DNRLRE domain-containing protein [Clostridia bacterium]|nr:DNRLRE domain-containing protein [Clostridia bacterium]
MKKYNVKAFSFVLMLLLVVNFIMPTTVFATSSEIPEDYVPSENTVDESIPAGVKEPKDPAQLQKELDEMTYEITSLRNENTKHIHLSDGTYQAVVYGAPIHRLNESGEWEEIDNSLASVNGAISTKDSRVKFAKKITGNESLYTLHNGHYKVTVGLFGAEKNIEGVVTSNSASEEGMTKLEKLTNIENISSSIVYADILDGVDLEYVLVSNSIKENIIVKEPSEAYCYTFTLQLNGLVAELEGGTVVLLDPDTDETIYRIPAPFMYDATGNESFEASYTLTSTGNGKYEFTLTADAEWINSAERSFPVVIDPMLVDIGQIDDTFVSSANKTRNFGGVHRLYVSSVSETYYKFATPTLPSGTSITSANVKFPYYFDSTDESYATVNLYKITSTWNESEIIWNTKATTSSPELSYAVLYADGATEDNPYYALFDVTSCVSSWYTGTANNGFALKYDGGSASGVTFVAKEKMQKFAQLTINYSGTHLGEGIYAIGRSGTNYYFKSSLSNTPAPIVQDTTSYTSPPSYLATIFKVSYRPTYNDYVIRSMIDSSLVVFPSVSSNAPMVGRRSESDSQLSTSYTWNIEYTGGYYYITYTQNGTKYYIRSASSSNNSSLVLTTNASATGTKWSFHQYTGNVYEDIEMEEFYGSIYVGDSYTYSAYMRSTRIGHNGPISYSLSSEDSSKASINSSTGLLQAKTPGEIYLKATYPGAPWIWSWRITISVLPLSGSEITYSPALWNETEALSRSYCYNYALNIRVTSTDDPYILLLLGALSGNDIFNYSPQGTFEGLPYYYREMKTGSEIQSIAMADANELGITFIPIGKNDVCPEGTYKIALVLDRDYTPDSIRDNYNHGYINGEEVWIEETDVDYHWYRQNPDGTWSHKKSDRSVTNLDNSNEVIYDPQICNRDYGSTNYSIFVGYYAISPVRES